MTLVGWIAIACFPGCLLWGPLLVGLACWIDSEAYDDD